MKRILWENQDVGRIRDSSLTCISKSCYHILFVDIATEEFISQVASSLCKKAEEDGIVLLDEHSM